MTHCGRNWELHVGDCRQILQELPAGSVQCCVTSPPYWALRDYQTPPLEWSDWSGSLGMEPTIEMYVRHMVEIFADVWRVLRDDGTLWVNLGDSYNANQGAGFNANKKTRSHLSGDNVGQKRIPAESRNTIRKRQSGLKPKDCCMIPERFAIAMQAAGWYVRSKITWCKKAPMPESCRDRPTNATEMIYLFTKKAKYFYDMDAARVATTTAPHARRGGNYKGLDKSRHDCDRTEDVWGSQSRNLWNYWDDLGQSNFSGAHFATFPIGLPLRCIKLGSSERGCCPDCGSPWQRVVEKDRRPTRPDNSSKYGKPEDDIRGGSESIRKRVITETITTGWQPGCDHGLEPVPCTVLDLFSGSHTTGIAALQLGRRYVGIELSEEYASDYVYRLRNPFENKQKSVKPGNGQMEMFSEKPANPSNGPD